MQTFASTMVITTKDSRNGANHTEPIAGGTHAIPIVGTRGKATWAAEDREIPETIKVLEMK